MNEQKNTPVSPVDNKSVVSAPAPSVPTVVQVSQDTTSMRIRFAKESGSNPKSPIAAYNLSLQGALEGLSLKGQIFRDAKDGNSISVSVPGGRNFGGIFHAEPELAVVSGRTIAISGSYDEIGLHKLSKFEDIIKTAFYAFIKEPLTKSVQQVSF